MANTPEKPKSNAPLLIIGAVLVVALLGGWYWFSTTKPSTNTAAATPKAGSTPAKPAGIPAGAPAGATPPNQYGSPTATVKLEEFADFQCPQCAATHPVLNEIKAAYGSRIHFIFRDFPLDIPAHDKSYDAAVAAEAAGMQNSSKFWEMQNLLFTNQKVWTADPNYKQIWKDYAAKIGLDVDKWETDMAGLPAKQRVNDDKARGKGAGINSTPTLFINNVEVPFAQMNLNGIKTIIDAELAKAAPGQQPAPAANTANANK